MWISFITVFLITEASQDEWGNDGMDVRSIQYPGASLGTMTGIDEEADVSVDDLGAYWTQLMQADGHDDGPMKES